MTDTQDAAGPPAGAGQDDTEFILDTPLDLTEEQEALLVALGSTIQQKADAEVNKRREIELRWMRALRRYHGVYESDVEKGIDDAGGSKAFLKLTRPKTDTFCARVQDKVMPTDGRNWDLKPSPVPEIETALGNSNPAYDVATGRGIQTPEGAPVLAKDVAAGMKQEAARRCVIMRDKIDDLLQESGFNGVMRAAIDDMGVYGTGIVKGPSLIGKTHKRWKKNVIQQGEQTVEQWVLEVVHEANPGVEHVSVWDFFPDQSAVHLKHCGAMFERLKWTRQALRQFRDMPGAITKNIDDLLNIDPETIRTSVDQHTLEVRALVGLGSIQDHTYTVWLYHGPLTADELRAAGMTIEQADAAELEGVAWVCDGKVLKAIIQPQETGERPYSMIYCVKDDTSIWGYGIPDVMESAQNAANGVWRMILDNAGLSVAPMLLVNDRKIEPIDGEWKITPRKMFRYTDEELVQDPKQVFSEIAIQSSVATLEQLLDKVMGLADQEANLPLMMQGIVDANPQETLGQALIREGAHDVVMRRVMSGIDDDLIATLIPRFVNWLMEFWDNEEAKGDYNLIAQGARLFLEQQQQTNAINQLLMLRRDPDAAPWINMRKVVEMTAKNARVEDCLYTQDQHDTNVSKQQAQAQQSQAQQPSTKAADPNDIALRQRELDIREKQLAFEQQKHLDDTKLRVTEIAQALHMSDKELMAKLGMKRMEIDQQNKTLNLEAQAKATLDPHEQIAGSIA